MAKKKTNQQSQKAVIYARYSSHAQNDMSIEQQVQLCEKLAASKNLIVLETYCDRAISGRSDNRPAFQKMMKDAVDGKFNVVISWKSSRIGRNMLEALLNENALTSCGVAIKYVEEDFADNAAGRFAARSMMNVNQFYSEAMAEDIKRGLMANAQECKVTGALPYGYRATPDKHYEIDEDKAEVVREIFRKVADGEPYAEICRSLNERGIVTASGGEWNKGSFHRMLANERYRGVYIYGDIRIENGIPRIIDDALFREAQYAAQTNNLPAAGARRRKGDYMLTGKLFCGECGTPMVGVSGTSKTNKTLHYYYACRKQRQGGCNKKAVRREIVEEAVAQAIRDNILQPEVIEWIADSVMNFQKKQKDNPELTLMKTELAEVKTSLKNIMTAIEAGIFNATTKDRMTELEDRQAALYAKIEEAEFGIVDVPREYVEQWLESFRKGDIKDKKCQKELFDSFLTAVYLYDDNRLKIVFDIGGGKQKEINLALLDSPAEEFVLPPQRATTGVLYEPSIKMLEGFFILTSSF